MADYNTILKNQKEDLDELLKADVLVRERMSGLTSQAHAHRS